MHEKFGPFWLRNKPSTVSGDTETDAIAHTHTCAQYTLSNKAFNKLQHYIVSTKYKYKCWV